MLRILCGVFSRLLALSRALVIRGHQWRASHHCPLQLLLRKVDFLGSHHQQPDSLVRGAEMHRVLRPNSSSSKVSATKVLDSRAGRQEALLERFQRQMQLEKILQKR